MMENKDEAKKEKRKNDIAKFKNQFMGRCYTNTMLQNDINRNNKKNKY